MAGPLEGLRVVELAGLTSAYGTKLLAAMGAEVIKVEPPGGEPTRTFPPHAANATAPESSVWFAYFAMGKRSVVIDTETTDGREQLRALLGTADMVVEDPGPGALDAIGCGYDAVSADNDGVIWVSITPYGLTGPHRNWKSSNLVAWASSGVLYTVGFPDQAPVVPGGPVLLGLQVTALNAAIGGLLGLRGRRRTGRGQLVDVSMQEACLSLSPETGVPLLLDDRVHRARGGNRRDLSRPFGLYPCSDGYVSILVLMPNHWKAMSQWIADVTGNDAVLEEVFEDVAVRAETKEVVDGWTEDLTTQLTKLEVFQEGQRRGIPITPVNTVADLRSDPHLDTVGFWKSVDHPEMGTVTIPGFPWRTSTDWWLTARAPLLGEHTNEVLANLS